MHGRNRRSALWPLRVNKDEVQKNLEKIAECIRAHGPDFVALQEVDAGSVLSGSFDQFEFLKERLGYPYGYFAPSCRVSLFGKKLFVSGQAVLSKYPLQDCVSHKFPITFPTDRMGFVLVDAKLPGGQTITIVSIHLVYLDWLHRNSREQELGLVEKTVSNKKSPVVLAGDFNCDMAEFAKRSGYEAPAGQATYPSWAPTRRIDWVLAKGLKVDSCQTLADQLSDHLSVFAQLNYKILLV